MVTFKSHLRDLVSVPIQLVSYIDVSGGSVSKDFNMNLISQFISVGKLTTAVRNPLKCKGPSQSLTILGHQYDASSQRVKLLMAKQQKYLARLRVMLSVLWVTSKEIESLIAAYLNLRLYIATATPRVNTLVTTHPCR